MAVIDTWINATLPEVLRATPAMSYVLGNKWLVALSVFIIFFALSKLFIFIIEKVILGLTAKTKTKIDDYIVERTNGPISWLLVFIGFKIAFEYIEYASGFSWFINNIILTLIYFAVSLVVIAVVVAFIDSWGTRIAKKTKSSIDDALLPLFRGSTKVALLVITAIMVLSFWGVDVAGLLAGVGIAGIAIGFAVKDSLGNIFGGISLILDRTFNVGDRIGLDDGTVGVIKDVSLRSTKILTFDNEYITIPNGNLAVAKIKNFHQPDRMMRVVIPFSVEYGAKPEKVKELVLNEIKGIKGIMADPAPSVVFSEMADFSLNMSARFYVEDIDNAFPKKEEATIRIYNLLNRKKIGIPFPTSTVYVHKGK